MVTDTTTEKHQKTFVGKKLTKLFTRRDKSKAGERGPLDVKHDASGISGHLEDITIDDHVHKPEFLSPTGQGTETSAKNDEQAANENINNNSDVSDRLRSSNRNFVEGMGDDQDKAFPDRGRRGAGITSPSVCTSQITIDVNGKTLSRQTSGSSTIFKPLSRSGSARSARFSDFDDAASNSGSQVFKPYSNPMPLLSDPYGSDDDVSDENPDDLDRTIN